MQRNQQGFTLIELVIVIVILGILSAFALPRFADLGGDARAASIEGAAGAMRSASSIVRSACLANSDCDDTSASITLEGEAIALDSGYPDATPDGIQLAAQIDDNDYAITDDADTLTVAADGAGGTCEVVFTNVTGSATESPDFNVDVSGC